jgi:hypothetical protein
LWRVPAAPAHPAGFAIRHQQINRASIADH